MFFLSSRPFRPPSPPRPKTVFLSPEFSTSPSPSIFAKVLRHTLIRFWLDSDIAGFLPPPWNVTPSFFPPAKTWCCASPRGASKIFLSLFPTNVAFLTPLVYSPPKRGKSHFPRHRSPDAPLFACTMGKRQERPLFEQPLLVPCIEIGIFSPDDRRGVLLPPSLPSESCASPFLARN